MFPLCLVLPLPGSVTFFSRLFLCWRPCRSRSLIPSLTPSWRWPCSLLRWALLALSGYVLGMPSAVSLRRYRCSIPSHCRPSCTGSLLMVSVIGARFAFAWVGGGRLPWRLVPWGPLGSCGGSTYIALHRTWLVSANLPCAFGVPVGVLCFTVRHSARIHGDHLVSFTDSCVSLARHSHEGMFLGHLRGVCLVGLTVQDSVICTDLWSRQSGPDASCDRYSVALALSPSLMVVMTPCYFGMLGGLHVLVGSLTYPSPGRMFEP